jgi:hypothetical protein
MRRKPDISLAGEKLDWGPTVNLEDGLEILTQSTEQQVDAEDIENKDIPENEIEEIVSNEDA